MGCWVVRLRGSLAIFALPVLTLVAACGARSGALAGEEGLAADDDDAGWTGRGYELKFDRFVDPTTGATSSFLPGGDRARLDLELTGDSQRAIVTPYAGDPNAYAVIKESARWILSGQLLGIELLTFRGFEYDRIELPVNDDGQLEFGGMVIAHGRAYNLSSQSDDPSSLEGGADFEASGTLEHDELSPALTARGPLRRRDDQLLPWDAVTITATEPVELEMLVEGASVEAGGQELSGEWLGWPFEKERHAAGVTQALFAVDDFSELARRVRDAGAGSMSAHLAAPGDTVLDPNGNVGRGGTSFDFDILRVGPASQAYAFDDVSGIAFWNAEWRLGTAVTSCLTGACMVFGALASLNECTEQGLGVLLTIDEGVSEFTVAFQAIGTGALPADQTLLTVQAVAPGKAPAVFEVPAPDLILGPNGWQYESGLQTVAVPVPAGSSGSQLGVTITPGPPGRCALDWAGVLTTISVEGISTQP